MRTRGQHRDGQRTGHHAGAVALAGLTLLAVGAGSPAQAAEQPTPGNGAPSKAALEPVQDLTPPQRPTLGEASTVGGTVSLEVQAESGSALVVQEGAEVVASASALGSTQTLSWQSTTGPHSYLVVATDAAGNVSDPATVTLDVDATPPTAEGFDVQPGTDRDSRSRWSVGSDPGTAYELLVDGTTVEEGTVEGREVTGHLVLADGEHRVELELRDESGNLRTLTETVTVDIPALWVTAEDVSEANDPERSFVVAAAPGTRGFLRIPGGSSAKFELPEGRAEVTLEVEEGSYAAPVVTVADSVERKGQVELSPFEVDRTAPAVQVEATAGAGERGVVSASITAGEGDTVTWRLVDERGIPAMSGQFVADGTAQLLEREVAGGSYELEVTATDARGNATVERVAATVAARPMVNPDVVPALVITAALWALFALVVLLRRRRARRLRELGGATRRKGLRTKRARLRREHELAVAEHEKQLAAYRAENEVWERRRDELAQLVAVAGGGSVEATTGIEVGPQERVLCELPAALLEVQHHDGVELPSEVEDGLLVVTSDRVVFSGTEDREWRLAELEQLRHLGQDRTVMPLRDQETASGVAYGDADLVRLYLELALAEHRGTSRSVRMMLEQGVRSHELRRPQPPVPVGPSPVRGRRARRNEPRSAAPVAPVAPVAVTVPAPSPEPANELDAVVAVSSPAAVMVSQQGEPAREQLGRDEVGRDEVGRDEIGRELALQG